MKAATATVKPTMPVKAPDIVTLGFVFIAAMILPMIPLLNIVIGPLTSVATLVHEMGHALACLLTGGTVSGMTIVSDGAGHGGLTFCRGGIPFIYSQTGYLGTTLAGCALIALARVPRASKIALGVLGVAFGAAAVTFMFGGIGHTGDRWQTISSMFTGLFLAAAFLRLAFKLSPSWANMLLLFVGVEIGLNALSDTWYLILLSLGFGGTAWSDATNMANMTHVPAFVWAVLWAGLTVWALLMTISWTYDEDFGKKKIK
jgi:hypothetical protein